MVPNEHRVGERFPLLCRGSAGEVYPNVVSPLTGSIVAQPFSDGQRRLSIDAGLATPQQLREFDGRGRGAALYVDDGRSVRGRSCALCHRIRANPAGRRARTPGVDVGSELVAWVATALAAVSALPQLRRLRSTRDLAGVSLAGPAIGVVTEAGWLAYVTETELWSAAPEPVLMVVANVVLSVAICRSGARPATALAAGTAWAAALAVVTVLGGWAALGAMLGVAYAVQVTPYVWSAYRAPQPSGIAANTWTLNLVEAALWGAYGLTHDDAPIVLYAIIGTAASAAVLARMAAHHPAHHPAHNPDSRRTARASAELSSSP